MDRSRRIALLLDRSLSFVRAVLGGIRAYADGRPHWIIRDGPPRLAMVGRVRDWRAHGIIAGLVVPQIAQGLIRLRRPLVDTAFTLPGLNVATVDVDHAAVGRMAAEYYLARKFISFAFYGSESARYSRIEERAFRDRLAESGHEVSTCYGDFLPDARPSPLWRKSAQSTVRWLRRLAKPVAVFVCEDTPARHLADLCRQLDLRIPGDVALLGVGNDELECRLTTPLLSSIEVPSRQIGFEAAALLDRLMSGHAPTETPILLRPTRVVTRQSTDMMAVEDEAVQTALQYIRRHVGQSLRVADVTEALAVGRRDLERRFRRVLGRSVLEEIHQARTEAAVNLLADTHLPVSAVARQSGFTSTRQLDVIFGRLKGLTPTDFRRQTHGYREMESPGGRAE